MGDENYPMAEACKAEVMPTTLTDSLKSERKRYQQKVDALDEAIRMVESEPGVQKILDALSKLGRLRNY